MVERDRPRVGHRYRGASHTRVDPVEGLMGQGRLICVQPYPPGLYRSRPSCRNAGRQHRAGRAAGGQSLSDRLRHLGAGTRTLVAR